MSAPEFEDHRPAKSGEVHRTAATGAEATPETLDHTAMEMRLLEYLDGRVTCTEAERLRDHLAGCPKCRQLQKEWQILDAKLNSRIKRPMLSTGFEERLWQKIEKEPGSLTEEARLARKQQLNAEFETIWAQYRKGLWRSHLPLFLDVLGYTTAAALGGYGLFKGFFSLSAAPNLVTGPWAWVPSCTAGVLFLFGAIALLARNRLAAFLAEF